MTDSEGVRRIPVDTFRVRLAIVRTEMGWNYDQAQAATGVGSESWRLWEKGQRQCTDVVGVSRKIAAVTSYDETWLAMGGPLRRESDELATARPLRRRRSSIEVRHQGLEPRTRWFGARRARPRLLAAVHGRRALIRAA